MEQYDITGMSCAACSASVEKAVSKVAGVTSCSVSLLTNSMTVSGTAKSSAIVNAVKKAGYGAKLHGASDSGEIAELKDSETPKTLKRLIASLVFLILLMYVSMGHTMWGFPLPSALENAPAAIGLLQMLLSSIVLVINQKFFINGFKGLIHRAPNMDTLVGLGSAAAFIYSACELFVMIFAQSRGESGTEKYLHELYFESAAMILVLITVGKTLEAHSKGKTTDALKSLMRLAPETALVVRDGEEKLVPVAEVKTDDIFIVKPGETVPVDGVVLEGMSAVNEAALTGESIPVDKLPGDNVISATLNQSGILRCRATGVGEETALAKIIKTVKDAAASKAPIAKIADKVSGVFVPVVMGIALLTTIIWLAVGRDIGFALARGISVLVISCPCALGLATPVAVMVGSGVGAKNGILFKSAAVLEETGKADIAVFDKTGTITEGRPEVTDVFPAEGVDEKELFEKAVALEKNSEHPLARAICERKTDVEVLETTEFSAVPGRGLTCKIGEKSVFGGNAKYIEAAAHIDGKYLETAEEYAENGKTPLFFAEEGRFLGIIAVADVIKSDAVKAIGELKDMGLRVIMLTGDNERTARAVGRQAGIDEVIAGVLPDGKERVIASLQKQGRVAMIGDGINDAPALTRADVGIAVGAGSDVAVDAGEVVLMKNNLSDVPAAIRLSRATYRNILENLFWAFIYNILGIPLAAGAYIGLFGWQLNPMVGAAAMSLSSVCVVTNALRLNLFKLYNPKHDRPRIKINIGKKKEKKSMEKTLKIEGMMCARCESHVKKALEALPEVASAEVSAAQGTAVVTLKAAVADERLKRAVEEQDYTVVEIK